MMLSSLLLAGTIVLPTNATRVERFAAEELSAGLAHVTGQAYAVVDKEPESGLRYLVGGDPLGEAPWKRDEIRLVRKGDRIVLTGDATRGPIYAVNEYLERVVGVRWWTKTESDYPRRPDFTPPETLDIRYAPPFAFRETLYLDTLSDARFKVRMKCNVTSRTRFVLPPSEEEFVPPEMGGNHRLVFFQGRRSSFHSFFEVLPPEKYAKDHPDWYSEVGGKRIGGGQLCVTNPEMLAEYVKNTLALLRESPDCDSIQVSQNDCLKYCECVKCRACYEAEGSWSGPYLEFANKVAEAVEKEFPNATVDTFAYLFTRKPPKTVRPRKNVLVRLCDNECGFNRPLADSPAEWTQNTSFMADLEEWSRVADGRLYIWDYQANFTSYILPHPNLHVFADNIRSFRRFGAVGVFEQGDALCPVGDFTALKQYVTAHLLWNPDLDWKRLRDEFLSGYYGPAAGARLGKVLEIAETSATRPDAPGMRCYHKNCTDWISDGAAKAALAELDAAETAARQAGEPYARRVQAARLSWDHACLLNWDRWGRTGDKPAAIRKWMRDLKDFDVIAYCETVTRKTLEDYLGKLDADAAGSTPQVWTVAPNARKYVKVTGDRVVVDVPPGVTNVCAYARASVDLTPYTKSALEAHVSCRGRDVVLDPRPGRGVKLSLHYTDPLNGRRRYPFASAPKEGSFGWTDLDLLVSFGELALTASTKAELVLGLQETSGHVEFSLPTLFCRKTPPLFPKDDSDRPVTYPERVSKLPRMRGVMGRGCCRNTEKDIEDLKNYGANLIRLQMNGFGSNRNRSQGERPKTLADWNAWLEKNLDHAERVLGWLEQRDMMMVLDLHHPPLGGYGPGGDVFYVKEYADRFVSAWREIAFRFKGRKGVYGYDLMNEPMQTRRALPDCDYWNLQRRAAEAIRAVDPEATIIVECNDWDGPSGYSCLRALDMDNVIYQVHMYAPMAFTHQGANGTVRPAPDQVCAYPDKARGWDKAFLRKELEPVRQFQRRHNAKIFVGEFSACIYGKGVGTYLEDCISIFEEYGWDWTYHSFREAPWWNVETVIDEKTGKPVPDFGNPRFQALVNGFRGKR